MMRDLRQQLIAGFLALCLVAAGFVGLSPGLHRLVEHAGQGPAHTHRGGQSHWHDHGDGRVHPHGAESDFSEWGEASPDLADWKTGSEGSGSSPSPVLRPPSPHPMGRGQGEGLEGIIQAGFPSSSESHPDHEHHGLVRMLDDGVLDCPPLWEPEFCPPAPAPCLDEFFTRRIPPSVWFAQAAGRAPPMPDV